MTIHQHDIWHATPDGEWEAKTVIATVPDRGSGLFMAVVARDVGSAELLPNFRYGPYLTVEASLADAPTALKAWLDFYEALPTVDV